VADYRFRNWLGIRGGKVKTTLGLYNDSQDLDFLRVFALLPQSVYPTDIRTASIAHLGGDIYGVIVLRPTLGEISYTIFAGHSSGSLRDGFAYLAAAHQLYYSSYGGLQYGGDLRWNTPIKGLMVGVSRMNQDLTGLGIYTGQLGLNAASIPESDHSRPNWTNQFYGRYVVGNLRIESECRRFLDQGEYASGDLVLIENATNVHGWYVSGTYQVTKRLAVGSYYSRYTATSVSTGLFAGLLPNQSDTSLAANHVYDKVISARLDLNKFSTVKLEGHFMDGYGVGTYPDGFYPQVNPRGFSPNTNGLVLRVGFSF
jgi:hypothetical protein